MMQQIQTSQTEAALTLVRAWSVFSGALRYAWVTSLRGRGMYWRVKLLFIIGEGSKREREGRKDNITLATTNREEM